MNERIKSIMRTIKNKWELFTIRKIIKGKGNHINFGEYCRLRNCNIVVHGKNNTVAFGKECILSGLSILIEGDNNSIVLGDRVVVNASKGQPTVINAFGGTEIKIGEDSLLSNNIEIHSTDYHGIYNSNGERINPDKSILIGSSVWIGLGVIVLKGTELPDGSIVGAGSIISRKFKEDNCIIAGNPATIIKRQVFWKPQRLDVYPVPENLKKKWNE